MVTDALASALAQMVIEAMHGDERWIRWAIETGETPVAKCACQARVGDEACVCCVEIALPRAYMIRAARRLELGQFVGMSPRKRRCLLCLRGEHDLDITTKLRVVVGDEVINEMRVPVLTRRRTRQSDRVRAQKAGAYVAGTQQAQIDAACLHAKEHIRTRSESVRRRRI